MPISAEGGTGTNRGLGIERILEASPRLKARMSGFFELLEALTSGFGQVLVPGIPGRSADAAAIRPNHLTHQTLYSKTPARSHSAGLHQTASLILNSHLFKVIISSV